MTRKQGLIALKYAVPITSICLVIALIFTALNLRKQNQAQYDDALEAIEQGRYGEAIDQLRPLESFQDTQQYLAYSQAMLYLENNETDKAIEMLEQLGGFNQSDKKIEEIQEETGKEQIYQLACAAYKDGNYKEAIAYLEKVGQYKDASKILKLASACLQRELGAHTIAAGIQCSASVTEHGMVQISANNFEESDIVSGWERVLSVSASNELLAALQDDGRVLVAKRDKEYKYRIDVSEWSNIIAVEVGEQFIVGLRQDGTLTAQGIDGYGETNIDTWENIVAIDTGWQHTVGLDSSGNVHITGYHSQEMLRDIADHQDEWQDIIAISTGGSSAHGSKGRGHVVALRADGSVVAAGDNSYGQCEVSEWSDIVAVSAGDYHTVGLRKDGTVLTTQRGPEFSESEAAISSWRDIKAIAAGYGFTLGVKADGTVVCAGLNLNGQSNVADWEKVRTGFGSSK